MDVVERKRILLKTRPERKGVLDKVLSKNGVRKKPR